MRRCEILKLSMLMGVAAVALAVGCSSTTQVKGSGKSGSGGDSGSSAGTGSGGAGNAAGDGGNSGAAGASGASGNAGAGGAAGAAGAGGSGGTGAGRGGASGAGAAGGSAGVGAAGTGAAGGVAGAGAAGASGISGAGGTGGISGAGGTGGISGAAGAGGTGNGCSVVSCAGASSCCTGTAVFVLDTPLQNYRDRSELVTRFSATSNGVAADFRFDAADQRGTIGFDLNRPIDVLSLIVQANYSGVADYPYIGLETDGGVRGCAYALVGTEADLSYPLFCWGSPAFLIRETTRVNVRVDSYAAGTATLSISSVDVN